MSISMEEKLKSLDKEVEDLKKLMFAQNKFFEDIMFILGIRATPKKNGTLNFTLTMVKETDSYQPVLGRMVRDINKLKGENRIIT